jgi:H+/Cl- antiporter ClcA
MNIQHPRNKGILISLVLIILNAIAYYAFGLTENSLVQYANLTLFVLGMVWVLVHRKMLSNNIQLTWKDFFAEGFKAFVVVALLMALYTIVFYKINPEVKEKGIAEINKIMTTQGNRTQGEIDQNANTIREIFIPMTIMVKVVLLLFMGSLVSLTLGLSLARKK